MPRAARRNGLPLLLHDVDVLERDDAPLEPVAHDLEFGLKAIEQLEALAIEEDVGGPGMAEEGKEAEEHAQA